MHSRLGPSQVETRGFHYLQITQRPSASRISPWRPEFHHGGGGEGEQTILSSLAARTPSGPRILPTWAVVCQSQCRKRQAVLRPPRTALLGDAPRSCALCVCAASLHPQQLLSLFAPLAQLGLGTPPPPTPQAAHPLQLKPLKHNGQQRGGRKGDQPAGTAPPRRDARFRPAAGGKSPCLSFSGEIATGILVPKLQHNFP